jgi:hypothetical protein
MELGCGKSIYFRGLADRAVRVPRVPENLSHRADEVAGLVWQARRAGSCHSSDVAVSVLLSIAGRVPFGDAIRYSGGCAPDMLYRLQRHALPIKAHFRSSLVLAYAVPASVLQPFLPAGLTLDTYGNFGFLAIALVETRDLRPSFVPARLGMSFFLSGYRIFTRYQTIAGRTLRGLRILRSDTNRFSMQMFGNLLTHYHYERSKFRVRSTDQRYEVEVTTPDGRADLHVEADLSTETVALPPGSPFADLKEARKFAGPLPFTFDFEKQTHSIIRVEGVRQRWDPRPVSVIVHQNTFLDQYPFRDSGAILANAFYLEDVPYSWRPGIRERLQ